MSHVLGINRKAKPIMNGSQDEESDDEYFGPEANSETDDEPLSKRKRVNPSTSQLNIDT